MQSVYMQFFTAIQQEFLYKDSKNRKKLRPTEKLANKYESLYIYETYNRFLLQMFHLIHLRTAYVLCSVRTKKDANHSLERAASH